MNASIEPSQGLVPTTRDVVVVVGFLALLVLGRVTLVIVAVASA